MSEPSFVHASARAGFPHMRAAAKTILTVETRLLPFDSSVVATPRFVRLFTPYPGDSITSHEAARVGILVRLHLALFFSPGTAPNALARPTQRDLALLAPFTEGLPRFDGEDVAAFAEECAAVARHFEDAAPDASDATGELAPAERLRFWPEYAVARAVFEAERAADDDATRTVDLMECLVDKVLLIDAWCGDVRAGRELPPVDDRLALMRAPTVESARPPPPPPEFVEPEVLAQLERDRSRRADVARAL